MDINEEKIEKLLSKVHDKVRHGEEYDSRFVIERANTINLIITLSIFSFLLCINNYSKIDTNLTFWIIKGFQFLFAFIFILFFAFRFFLYRYESYKKSYLSLLELHFIELILDKSKIVTDTFKDDTFIIDLNNAFVGGTFDVRRKIDFNTYEKSIKKWGSLFTITHWIILGLFIFQSILTLYIIFKFKF